MFERTVSGITLTLLFIGMLTLVFNIQLARAEWWELEVKVTPEHPELDDLVNVTVSFTFATLPPDVEEFGPLNRVGNTFFVNVTVYLPAPEDVVFMVVHTDGYVYHLGNLSAGHYKFEVYVETIHYMEGYWLGETIPFTVAPPHGPIAEFAAIPDTALTGESVKFDASASLPGWNGTHEMPITEYRWNFGGGINITTPTPIMYYSFISPGIYYVTLTVYAPGATPETDSTSQKVTITAIPIGGYSFSIKGYTTTKPLTLYLALVATLAVSFTMIKRKTHRRTKQSKKQTQLISDKHTS